MRNTTYITALRFPLALLVVLIHTYNSDWRCLTEGTFPIAADFLSHTLTGFAVPLFFAISGYLFFFGADAFTPAVYAGKLRRRVRTLLLPYVMWNLCAYGIYTALDLVTGQPPSLPLTPDLLWGCRELGTATVGLAGIPTYATTAPVLMPLWFVRDLMLCVILSPLVWWLLRRTGGLLPLLLFAACFLDLWPNFGGVSLKGLFFFSLGAAFSVPRSGKAVNSRPGAPAATRRLFIPALITIPLTLCARLLWPQTGPFIGSALGELYTFSAMIAAIHIADLLTRNRQPSALLAGSSFFIYAAHVIVLRPLTKAMSGWAMTQITAVQLTLFLCSWAAAVAICLVTYAVVSRLCPRLSAPLTGQFNR